MFSLSRRSLLKGSTAALACLLLPAAARAQLPLREQLDLPQRPRGAPGGSELGALIAQGTDTERYSIAADQILGGNTPASLQRLTPVTLLAPAGHRGAQQVTIAVTPDYLSVGCDEDAVRMPLDRIQACRIACALGMSLPTPRMVDAIYAAATTVLTPAPMPPTAQMRSMPYVLRHHALVESGRAGRPVLPLIAGHKKDVVLTSRLHRQPQRVAIYGWHRSAGRPIQPLSLVHGKTYADYSHGIRLVDRTVTVDGAPMDLFAALEDPAVAPLLTRESTLYRAGDLLNIGYR